ncbi:hypothetical protein Z043_115669 [Scleropages formosus]|uniref:Ephrin RBD domain-containing protein n=1 Tax=Scleropages formosus TaxID=113540 RepID=A0A0P7U7F2_SCLFO|nr:hypothetical protein Z043_115669 [Scleropages formosus]
MRFVPGQGLVLYPQIGDKMDIVCPRGEAGQVEGVELYKLYMVDRKQLDTCTVTEADTPLLNCDKPDQDVKFTLKFQEFSPNLWGLEFFRGIDYYIIFVQHRCHVLARPESTSCRSPAHFCLRVFPFQGATY